LLLFFSVFIRKTLAAFVALSALSVSVWAAQVQLYGLIDQSLMFEAVNAKDGNGRVNTLYMSSGEEMGSRWGIRGFEELGNGYQVGFELQSGFRSDDGTEQYGRIFARESTLYVKGPFGKISAGHMDAIIGTRTSSGKIYFLNAWGDGYGPYNPSMANVFSEASYVDNALFYESPKMAGFTIRAQYSMKMDDVNDTTGVENKASSDRYAGATITYENGGLKLLLGADTTLYGHTATEDPDNGYTIIGGGMYDFGFMTVHAGVQYFDSVRSTTIRKLSWTDVPNKLTGWAVTLSTGVPCWGGRFIAAVDYLDAEEADDATSEADVKRLVGGVGYQYPLSKRTHLYGILSVGRDTVETDEGTVHPNYYKAGFGIRHSF
jgi:predicted porin